MYTVSEYWTSAIDSNAVQHIRGTLTTVTGDEIALDETTLSGEPFFEKQATSDREVFNFGETFVGTAEINAVLPDIASDDLKGGEFTLETGVELPSGETEWIPLGVWDIVSAERQADIYQIKGCDHMNRLSVPTNVDVVSVCTIKSAMQLITERTGVGFAQTPEEITQLAGTIDWSPTFAATCLDEVRMLAQYIGCLVFIDRAGKIFFKRLGGNAVRNIPADRRFSSKISEYSYRVTGVSYTDVYGQTVTSSYGSVVRRQVILGFSENRYMWDTDDDPHRQYRAALARIHNYLSRAYWYPGTVEYYGDAALDPGDMVTVEVGGKKQNFLITAISWKFRSPQTLVSAGEPETSSSGGGSSSSSGSVTVSTTVSVTKNIKRTDLKTYPGDLAGVPVMIAGGAFSCRSGAAVFAEFSVGLLGTQDSVFEGSIYIGDEIAATVKETLRAGEYSHIRITVPFEAPAGTHKVQLFASGYAVQESVTAYVWGQNITPESAQLTDESDYTYVTAAGKTTVTGYIGSVLYPRIPEYLGGSPVTVIGSGAFRESPVTAVYIPDGALTIK